MSKSRYTQKPHKYVCPVWTEERKQWLIENTKGLGKQEAFDLFKQRFPEYEGTIVAVTNQRSRLKCGKFTCSHGSTKCQPLYSEQRKKGYCRIKVAMPSVWWQKQKWVWVATHPERVDELLETDCFVFLDGNNKNFDWKNIELLHRREQLVFLQMGGVVPDDPELTRLHILQARLKLVQLDALEKIGEVVCTSAGRKTKEKTREDARKRYAQVKDSEHWKKVNRERAKKYRAQLTDEQKEKRKAYQREWARKKREQTKGSMTFCAKGCGYTV